jgi:hypothetical protein
MRGVLGIYRCRYSLDDPIVWRSCNDQLRGRWGGDITRPAGLTFTEASARALVLLRWSGDIFVMTGVSGLALISGQPVMRACCVAERSLRARREKERGKDESERKAVASHGGKINPARAPAVSLRPLSQLDVPVHGLQMQHPAAIADGA